MFVHKDIYKLVSNLLSMYDSMLDSKFHANELCFILTLVMFAIFMLCHDVTHHKYEYFSHSMNICHEPCKSVTSLFQVKHE